MFVHFVFCNNYWRQLLIAPSYRGTGDGTRLGSTTWFSVCNNISKVMVEKHPLFIAVFFNV